MGGVSKSLRFQILRRDGHRCHYCGNSPPDVKLAVDHILPVVRYFAGCCWRTVERLESRAEQIVAERQNNGGA